MPSIYELTEQYKRLEDAAYSEEIDEEEFNQLLMEIEGEIESKVNGYCAVIADLKADADALKAEADRITARRRSLERTIDRMKTALETALDEQGRAKIKTELWTVALRTSTRLEITDLSLVPPEYIKPITEASVMKGEIKKQLVDTGEVLPWCRLVEGRSLTIR